MRRETPIDFELNIICLATRESRQAIMLRKVRWTERAHGVSKKPALWWFDSTPQHPEALARGRKAYHSPPRGMSAARSCAVPGVLPNTPQRRC